MMKLPVVARFCVKFGRQMRQVMPLGRPRRVAMDNMSEPNRRTVLAASASAGALGLAAARAGLRPLRKSM